MTAHSESNILIELIEALNANQLRLIIDSAEINCNDKRSRESLKAAIVGSNIPRRVMLESLNKEGLQQICDAFDLARSGTVVKLIDRIDVFCSAQDGQTKIPLTSEQDFHKTLSFSEEVVSWPNSSEINNAATDNFSGEGQFKTTEPITNVSELDFQAKSMLERHFRQRNSLAKPQFFIDGLGLTGFSGPIFDSRGDPIFEVPSSNWFLNFDTQSNIFICRTKIDNIPVFIEKEARHVLCIRYIDEEVNDLKHTAGRLALTAVGTNLFWKGKRGGVGAALLDLSVRGAEKKTIFSGEILFNDMSLITFSMNENMFEKFLTHFSEEQYSDDALEKAEIIRNDVQDRFNDGKRVVVEMAVDVIESVRRLRTLNDRAESLQNYSQRTQARRKGDDLLFDINSNISTLKSLIFYHKMSFLEILSSLPTSDRGDFEILAKNEILADLVVDWPLKAAYDQADSNIVSKSRDQSENVSDKQSQSVMKPGGFFRRFFS